MSARPSAPATERNKGPILEVLRYEFRSCRRVLEIGSGTGQHAVHFAAAMPQVHWQTSDLLDNHAGIGAWLDWANLPNIAAPLEFDVSRDHPDLDRFDAVFSANTAHIMSMPLVVRMFEIVGRALEDGGIFCLYGPFNVAGEFSSESNQRFDASLKSRDADMGIRDLETLDSLAERSGMARKRFYAMPANNNIVVWQNQAQRLS